MNSIKYLRNLVMWLAMAGFSSSALAGGWVSGGGELFKDQHNPWFLSNTPRATYCVMIDEAAFGIDRAAAEAKITAALAYWKAEIAGANEPNSSQDQLVGTQTFVKVDSCSTDVDIKFQFGILTTAQSQQIEDPTQFVALSVRTEYDPRTLHGRGFIYVSPENGPLAPQSLDLVQDRWHIKNGKLLELTLMHELGHVFGLQHSGTEYDLMGEGYTEQLVSEESARFLDPSFTPHVLTLGTVVRGADCTWSDLSGSLRRFFGIMPTWQCVKIELTKDGFEIFAKAEPDETLWTHIGAAQFSQISAPELEYAFVAYVTDQNQVLKGRPGRQNLTPFVWIMTSSGYYNSDDGIVKNRRVSAYLNPKRPRLSGVLSKGIIPNLFDPNLFGE